MKLTPTARAETKANLVGKSTSDLQAAIVGIDKTIDFCNYYGYDGCKELSTELREIIFEIIAERT